MRRWNGWGDDTTDYPAPAGASAFLEALVGPGTPPRDAKLADVVGEVPASRLLDHPLITKDPLQRLRHARGQSLPDWLALRSGRIEAIPDGVSYPLTEADVQELIDFVASTGTSLIPYGGGTSVVGHINPLPGDTPVLTVDMGRMNRLVRFDETSNLATFEAGIAGPDLEAQLRSRGYTLGHFPQSFEFSTLGGWIATRSSGQQSLCYGRIEDLFAGGRLQTPAGSVVLPPFPASAAGPDLRQLVLGSEGRLGIITEATLRVTALPAREEFTAVFLPNWGQAQAAVRKLIQAHLPMSMLRLSTPVETTTTLALAGHERVIGAVERLLALRGASDGKCLLLMGFTGSEALVKIARREALEITRRHEGVHVGRTFGSQWHRNRFRTPYLRNTLWTSGYAVDTLETATPWSKVPAMVEAIESALHQALMEAGERTHVFTHLSHVYPSGSSIYTTFLFRLAPTPEETLHRWQALKEAASQAIVTRGGTISHQHGVGTDHLSYLRAEKGQLGMAAIQDMLKRFDPQGVMNPGKLA